MLYLVLILGFLTVTFVFLGLYTLLFSKRIGVANRLQIYTKNEAEDFDFESISFKEFILSGIGSIGRVVSRKNYMEDKRKKLLQAYVSMRVEELLLISFLVGLGIGLLLYSITKLWILGILGFLIAFKIPDSIVSSIKKKRMKLLNSQLPEALTILGNGLRAGLSFTQAMNIAAMEMDSPIRDEFLRIIRDNSIGKTMDEALIDFSERTDDEDIDMFVTALIIQRKVGGNLAEVLDSISETIRDRARIRGEIKTLTAQSKISAIIITMLPIGMAIILFIMNPDYIMELFRSTIGLILVGIALFMQVIGGIIMMRMANIEI